MIAASYTLWAVLLIAAVVVIWCDSQRPFKGAH